MVSKAFQRWTGLSAVGLAVGGIAYSIAFLVFLHGGGRNAKIANSALLLVGGVVMTMVFVALYERLRVVDAAFALWGAIIGIAGALASALHGGFDLAIAARRLPSPELSGIDPRGLGTFALTAIGVAVLSALMRDPTVFPTRLRYLGLAAATGLFLVYIGRMTIYDPNKPVMVALLVLVGFVLNPTWYLMVGLWLRGDSARVSTSSEAAARGAGPTPSAA